MDVALVNANRIRPPIGPIGLEYTAEALNAAGHRVRVLDLAFEKDIDVAIDAFFTGPEPTFVGISLRNTDDCALVTRTSFLASHRAIVQRIRAKTGATTILGGAGFSVIPKTVLSFTGADAGIRGEGEFILPLLAECIERRDSFSSLPGLVMGGRDGNWIENRMQFGDLATLPTMRRTWFDNKRYFSEGGQAGVETKRGCTMPCTFCADPISKGRAVRLRPPVSVVDEIEALLSLDIDHFHTCDSEFNTPENHARSVCEEIVRRGIGKKLRWYAYCTPSPFSLDLALLMKRAGCAGINFSVDHGDPGMLQRLKRFYSPDQILDVAAWCKSAGIRVMFDLLLGTPHETRETVLRAISLMKRTSADRIGIAFGLRVWPGTEIFDEVTAPRHAGGLVGGADPLSPLFYLEPAVANIAGDIDRMIGDDPRFLFLNPDASGKNYNYNDNHLLEEAIRKGKRGAYWDIL